MEGTPALDIARLLRTLERYGVEFVVIGGVAVVVHGHSRATFDLDICQRRTQQNARALMRALRELGAQVRQGDKLIPMPADFRVLERGETFILRTDAGDLDCVGVPDGTRGFDDLIRNAWVVPFEGSAPLFASIEDLVRMKEASGAKPDRAKDRLDLEALRLIQGEERPRG